MQYCLSDFVHIRPRFELEQTTLLEWIAKIHALASVSISYEDIKDKLLRLGSGGDKIQKRGFQISDPFLVKQEEMQIYPVATFPEGVGLTERMQFFDRETSAILEQFYDPSATLPDHMIHVTCTGYISPSPAQKLVSKRNQPKNTVVTHAYHMGCYASIPATRIGAGALAFCPPVAFVDIVHTEMCSLHMHPTRHSTEQLIVQSLFADGFIKYTMRSVDEVNVPHLKILSLIEEIIPNSVDSMTWRCEDICHSMTLSKEVPVFITRFLQGCLSRLIKSAGCDEKKVREEAYFAIHPGGPKIVQHIKQLLSLQDHQLLHSFYVLQNYGNMSSATLPHIWERMLLDDNIPDNAYIVSFAFGPGLSVSGALFQKKCPA